MPNSGSSRSRPGIDSDGTHGVRCYQCRTTIARTTLPMTRALCALCQASADGVELTEEAIAAYRASQDLLSGVGVLMIEEPMPLIPGLKKFSLSELGAGFSRAVGFIRRKPADDGAAARLARQKRRTPLLAGLSAGDTTSLGEMSEVDRMLIKDRGQR